MTFCTLLAVLFIGLKLAKIITWSWVWVLAPLWVPFVVGIAFLLVVVLIKLFA